MRSALMGCIRGCNTQPAKALRRVALLVVFDGSSTVNTIGVASNLTAAALVGRRVVVAGRSASDWLVIAAV